METIGFIGIGRIGLPICKNLIDRGRTVVGYRRSSLDTFRQAGGTPATSAADVTRRSDVVFTCLPSDEALADVVNGPDGILAAIKPGQIVVEFGSHPVSVKEKYVGLFAGKQAIFLDGEVSGTPGMVEARKAAIYLAGDKNAAQAIEPIVADFADVCLYLGAFGAATTVKLINNLLVGATIAGTAQAMAIGLKAGVDPALMIKAVAAGSGGATQFNIRAPWMAERRFLPQQGPVDQLLHYLDGAKGLADSVGVATPLLDCLIDLYRGALAQIGERDVAAIVETFENGGKPKT